MVESYKLIYQSVENVVERNMIELFTDQLPFNNIKDLKVKSYTDEEKKFKIKKVIK